MDEQPRVPNPGTPVSAVPDETALYLRACEGDEEALEQLIAAYRGPLTGFICTILPSRWDAEDVMIDTFAELAASRGRFSGRSSLKTYLFSIARHLALKRLRKGRELPLEQEQLLGLLNAQAAQALHEDTAALQDALARLRPDYRQALVLVYLENMSHQQTARIMHRTTGQVNHLVARAREALRKQLKEEP